MNFINVINFWFESADNPKFINRNLPKFSDEPSSKQFNFQQFFPIMSQVGEGNYSDWLEQPLGTLAQIILLDQIARRIYFGHATAFRYEEFCIALCQKGLAKQQDQELMPIQRAIFYFPLLHSENIENQQESCFLYRQLTHICLPEQKALFDDFYQIAQIKYKTINAFQRFPERNLLLGRRSTYNELLWLRRQFEMKKPQI